MMMQLRRQRSPVDGDRPANQQRRTSGERPRSRRRAHLVRAKIERAAQRATPEMPSPLSSELAADDLCQIFCALLDDEDPEGALRDLTVPAKPEE